jgi:hypothetical protein
LRFVFLGSHTGGALLEVLIFLLFFKFRHGGVFAGGLLAAERLGVLIFLFILKKNRHGGVFVGGLLAAQRRLVDPAHARSRDTGQEPTIPRHFFFSGKSFVLCLLCKFSKVST